MPRWVTVRKAAAGPSTQISVVSVSPGWPGLENRPSIERNRTGSSAQSVWSSARPAKPIVPRPIRIGPSKPATFANHGSEWIRLWSPEAIR